MNKIVFADGTEIINGEISQSSGNQVMVSIPGSNLVEAVTILNDSSKTSEMTCYYSVYKKVYTGYTQLNSIGVDDFDKKVRGYLNGVETSINESYTVPEIYLPEEMRHKEDDKDGNEESSAS